MKASVQHWLHDDDGYEKWIASNPNGFQANLFYPDNVSYFLVHSAKCKLSDKSNPNTKNPRTGNDYSKLTADSIEDLMSWGIKKGLKFGTNNCRYCKRCNPGLNRGNS
jgi:hypothetical protein